MTERLYYNDSYLTEFVAEIEEAATVGRRLYLNRTAFYPTSGGQLHDLGTINGVPVVDVVDEQDRLAHVVDGELPTGPLTCVVNWQRRFDHMQQHSGQHLLSAVFDSLLNARTASVHFGEDSATVDLEIPSLSAREMELVERRANELIAENRVISVSYEDAETAEGLRKTSGRQGTLRLVSIDQLDKSACGGTHVRATGEIGPVVLRKLDKIRGNVRVEFLCGMRAIDQLRRDYNALNNISRQFSCALEETPKAVEALLERAKEQDKTLKVLSNKLAEGEGRELHAKTGANSQGLRVVNQRSESPLGDAARLLAQHFVAQGNAAILLSSNNPPSLILACSGDSNLHAGNLLKAALNAAGGKGGGSNTMAQGSLPSLEALEVVCAELAKNHGL